jgi:hypothetical protein
MSTTLPPTPPISPVMRQTLEILQWAAEGFANANRIRRARLTGNPEFTGADAMQMYLKSQGIDIQHLDDVVRGLMQDGQTAASVKEVMDVVSDAAIKSPKDLSELVQRLARAATGTVPPPNTTPAAAPPGTSWTMSPSGKQRFRPEYTSAASPAGKQRFRPEYTSAACKSGVTPHVPAAPQPPVQAANEVPAKAPEVSALPVCVDIVSPVAIITSAASCSCTDPPPEAAPVAHPPRTGEQTGSSEADEAGMSRLDALERRLDVVEANQAREIAQLRQWATEQLHTLSKRIAKSEAVNGRIEQEHAALKQRVQQLEAALAARDGKMPDKTGSTAKQTESSPAMPLEPAQDPAQPGHAPAERVQETPEPPVAVSATAPIDETAPAAGREDPPPAAPEKAHAPATTEASAAVPSSVDPARPTDLEGRIERAEKRLHEVETNRHMIDELKRDLTHQRGAVHHTLPEEQG